MTGSLEVIDPGPLTTVQDLGRWGYLGYGVPLSGALDGFSARVANWLVGNPEDMALLEATFMGPKLLALTDCVVAVTGAETEILINSTPQRAWESFLLRKGDLLWLKPYKRYFNR
jgi:allophanate hydrolase subunit 2